MWCTFFLQYKTTVEDIPHKLFLVGVLYSGSFLVNITIITEKSFTSK